jgi:hypothetical protein
MSAGLRKRTGEKNRGTFDEAIADDWFLIIWGRIAAPYAIDQKARAGPPSVFEQWRK